MESISQQFADMSISNYDVSIDKLLENDTDIIIKIYFDESPSIMDKEKYLHASQLAVDHSFRSAFLRRIPNEMVAFKEIMGLVEKYIPSIYFLEICPLIDEYIEYVFSFKN